MLSRPARPPRFVPLLPLLVSAGLLLIPLAGQAASKKSSGDGAKYRPWIEEMKTSPKGPFSRIRWFCADGTIQPPKAYACQDHGGGRQHGEWSDRTKTLRRHGWEIGNVLAALDPDDYVGDAADLDGLKQILLERFLRQADDGWIFRRAVSYRGALQAEDEERGARSVVMAMLADARWRDPARFVVLRETVRLFPLEKDAATASGVRQHALDVSEKDPGFSKLRAKIHNAPDGSDAEAVRAYAKKSGKPELAADYAKIAADIDALYKSAGAAVAVDELAKAVSDEKLAKDLRGAASRLREVAGDPEQRFRASALLAADLRGVFEKGRTADSADASLRLMQASLALETDNFTTGNTLLRRMPETNREDRLQWLGYATEALYGAGFVSQRHVGSVQDSLKRLKKRSVTLNDYREELRFLSRGPEWCDRWLAFQFGPIVEHWSSIEPLSHMYSQDRLRSSTLLFYSTVADSLVRDANHEAGIEHELFGKKIGTGLRALNPGLARGTLRDSGKGKIDREGIYLLPETVSDLPPVAGILTLGEGSSLSHVQLLARNLGIPNVVVTEQHVPTVRERAGQRVVMAVSPGGVVQLDKDSARWDEIFGRETPEDIVIRPDLQKLDLANHSLVPLTKLRATDSGRLSGPKGANLGEIKYFYGDAVPDGFVIPFGVFRLQLDRPLEKGGPSVWEWMKSRYEALAKLDGKPDQQARETREFLARLRNWITTTPLSPELTKALRSNLKSHFGKDGTYGVFVRSDTNVEDLEGFTGAGLNLTVPNVVGFDNITQAIRDVWASPFTERAFGWRQSLMEQPEYVFPAVVVQYSFPSEKSGVMVTADVDTGETRYFSIAVNEGVGGAVEGQAAEALRIDQRSGDVHFLAQATAPTRMVLDPQGGLDHVPASGSDAVLTPDETKQLLEFGRAIPKKFPSMRTDSGQPVPADVEFGFKDGKLTLLQMRPFVESKSAARSSYLIGLDQSLRERGKKKIRLDQIPKD